MRGELTRASVLYCRPVRLFTNLQGVRLFSPVFFSVQCSFISPGSTCFFRRDKSACPKFGSGSEGMSDAHFGCTVSYCEFRVISDYGGGSGGRRSPFPASRTFSKDIRAVEPLRCRSCNDLRIASIQFWVFFAPSGVRVFPPRGCGSVFSV